VAPTQAHLCESLRDFFTLFQNVPEKTPHTFHETLEKDHGRIEHRRCYAFDPLDGLHRPERWPDLKSFAVIESSRFIKGKTPTERRFYISSLPPDASRLATAIRQHWHIENRLHGCMDVVFADDQMRVRTRHAAHNLAVLKQLTLNLFRLNPPHVKGASRLHALSPPLPIPSALNSSPLPGINPIAFMRSPCKSRPTRGVPGAR
jgi:predicted transposase YbfD/YdcC